VAFASLLRTFACALASDPIRDHAPDRPHIYLDLMRSELCGVAGHCIQGAAPDLLRLAEIVEQSVGVVGSGERASVGSECAPTLPYPLPLRVKPPVTAPASLEPRLASEKAADQTSASYHPATADPAGGRNGHGASPAAWPADEWRYA
jgi:hypothetical protein